MCHSESLFGRLPRPKGEILKTESSGLLAARDDNRFLTDNIENENMSSWICIIPDCSSSMSQLSEDILWKTYIRLDSFLKQPA